MRGMQPAIDDGAGNAETRAINFVIAGSGGNVAAEFFNQFFEAGKIARGVSLASGSFKFAIAFIVGDEL
jgi:hypothetical protein